MCAIAYEEVDFEELNIEVIVRDNVFAFRGTDEAWDAVRDLRILPIWTRELGWCPAGFLRAAKRLMPKCLSECMDRDIDKDDIVLTGHSLGGAVALIVGALMVRDEVKIKEICTFGAPRCGRLKILDSTSVTMYRHGKDVVPMVPPIMRRHKPLVTVGKRNSYIKDHYLRNYLDMEKNG
tara:strand:- start:115 stop:651 length:537 start_codon:yes stop_codon:yes gene_type:complete